MSVGVSDIIWLFFFVIQFLNGLCVVTCTVLQREAQPERPVSWLCCGFVTTAREPSLPWRSCRWSPVSQKPRLFGGSTHTHTVISHLTRMLSFLCHSCLFCLSAQHLVQHLALKLKYFFYIVLIRKNRKCLQNNLTIILTNKSVVPMFLASHTPTKPVRWTIKWL